MTVSSPAWGANANLTLTASSNSTVSSQKYQSVAMRLYFLTNIIFINMALTINRIYIFLVVC